MDGKTWKVVKLRNGVKRWSRLVKLQKTKAVYRTTKRGTTVVKRRQMTRAEIAKFKKDVVRMNKVARDLLGGFAIW